MLIGQAQAQAAEATKVAQDAAEMLFQYKMLGLFCLFLIALLVGAGFVIRHLYNDGKAKDGVILSLTEKITAALEGSRDANEKVADHLGAIKTTFETRVAAIGDLSHQIERVGTDQRHSFANLTHATGGIVDLLREIRAHVTGWFGRTGSDR